MFYYIAMGTIAIVCRLTLLSTYLVGNSDPLGMKGMHPTVVHSAASCH